MKKQFYLLFLFLSFINVKSQTQDLTNIAKGEILNFSTLFEKNNKLYGYFALYTTGKTGEGTKSFEYVILDKNLNKIANKEFEAESCVDKYTASMNIQGKIKIEPSISYLDKSVNGKNFTAPNAKIIDLKKNTLEKEKEFCYINSAFIEYPNNKSSKDAKKDNELERKEKGYIYGTTIHEIKQGGFLVADYEDHKTYLNNNNIIRFDDNKKELWKYSYNKNGNEKNYEYLTFIDIDDKNMYAIMGKVESGKKYNFSLLVFNSGNGTILANKPLNDLNETTLHHLIGTYEYLFMLNTGNIKSFDDKIILVEKNYLNDYSSTGYARLMIDKKTFEVRSEIIDFKNDVKKYIPNINFVGTVEKSFSLELRDLFFMKDGSIGILTEKARYRDTYKTLDLIYLYTDKDFKLEGIKTLEKEKDRNSTSDYLFSQYLNDDKDVVFFYKDERKNEKTKKKETSLFINTIIGAKFNQEQIPIGISEKNIITPYIAKEGYILLREYNDNEKEKYNQIRLEKLNY
jgi:hypothetical protein